MGTFRKKIECLIIEANHLQKLREEGIESKNSEALSYLKLRNKCVERITEIEQEYAAERKYIKKLTNILKEISNE